MSTIMNRLLILAAVCVVSVAAVSEPHAVHRLKKYGHMHITSEQYAHENIAPLEQLAPEELWHTQTLDHFDGENTATYQQRYFVNDTFWKGGDSPAFIYIQGEGSLSPYSVVFGEHMELAAQHGALVFSLEHRYYGASVPVPDFTAPNMKWLSSQQALADLASFISTMKNKYNLTSANKWVSFGGSYSGALAAWLRLKYPHIVHAAVSSSGPVHAIANFEEYNEVIGKSLSTELVGGSIACLDSIKAAFNTVSDLLTSEQGRSQLSSEFNTCQPLQTATDNNTITFVQGLSGLFQGVVQYNNEMPGMNIREECTILTNSSNVPLTNLANLAKASSAGQCLDISYEDELAQLQNTTVDKSHVGVGIRQWLYQTCTQFGYYQTCDQNTTCPFGFSSFFSLNSNLGLCKTLFNVSPDDTLGRIDFTDEYYGSTDVASSRIVFVNGLVDPWHALSVLQNLSSDEIAIVIPGTAHCANMNPSTPEDPPQLTKARQLTATILGGWLTENIHVSVQHGHHHN